MILAIGRTDSWPLHLYDLRALPSEDHTIQRLLLLALVRFGQLSPGTPDELLALTNEGTSAACECVRDGVSVVRPRLDGFWTPVCTMRLQIHSCTLVAPDAHSC
jgi:hypothetical protein